MKVRWMLMHGLRRLLITATVVVPIVLLADQAPATVQSQGPAAPPADGPAKSIEYLLLGDASRGAGEPMIAVDPTNPLNIIATAMGSYTEPVTPAPGASGQQPRSTIPWLAVTHDGGRRWTVGELPILSGTFTRCPDAMADVTKEGMFIAGCEPRETIGQGYGMSAIVMSDDKGDTWGPRTEIISSFTPQRFAPGLKPVIRGASPWDRPYTYIDDSTGVIYGVAQGGSTDIDTEPGQTRSQSYITASTDHGKSFGTIYAWDSLEYPQMRRGAGVAAAHGTVAVLYVASKVPASENATCPCVVFGLSRDQGKTFSHRTLKNIPPTFTYVPQAPGAAGGRGAAAGRGAGGGGRGAANAPVTGGRGGQETLQPSLTEIALTADPTKAGRYAIRIFERGPAPEWKVIVTEDHGQTWSTPVRAGFVPDAAGYTKSTIEYSRDGIVGFMWKATYADGSFDVWCSISRDGGKSFSRSLRVSHARSPGSLTTKGAGLDHVADLSMDKENIHMVWGDFRSGFLGTYYGRVAFTAFEFP